MFGIDFAGFDDGTGLGLRPLLLPDGFEGTPLRKSFQLAARASKPWPGGKEPGEGHESATSPDAAAGCRHRACRRRSGGRDEPARGDGAGPVGARRLPRAAAARRADRAQGDGAHAGPARPDVRRRLPRLGPAGRRRGEVRAEGGHHPARRRPVGLPPRPGGRPDALPAGPGDHPARARASPPSTCPARWCSCSPPPRWVRSAPSWRAGPAPTSTPSSEACAPPPSWSRYELPIVLAVASIALAGSSLSLATLTDRWSPWWMLWQLPGARRLPRRGLAELQRPPFDMPVADAELVMGAWTEYTGPALRLLPARRVRRDRRDVAALRLAVAGRVARPVRGHPGLAVDAAQGLRASPSSSSGSGSRGPGCARTSCSGWPGSGSCRSRSASCC